jgi:hypothetical protein
LQWLRLVRIAHSLPRIYGVLQKRKHLVIRNKQVGDSDHLKVFANGDAAETWFKENDPEGVAFEYEVLE